MKLLLQMGIVIIAVLSVAALGIEQRYYHSVREGESPLYNSFRWVQYDWAPSFIEYFICGIIVVVAVATIHTKFGEKVNQTPS